MQAAGMPVRIPTAGNSIHAAERQHLAGIRLVAVNLTVETLFATRRDQAPWSTLAHPRVKTSFHDNTGDRDSLRRSPYFYTAVTNHERVTAQISVSQGVLCTPRCPPRVMTCLTGGYEWHAHWCRSNR